MKTSRLSILALLALLVAPLAASAADYPFSSGENVGMVIHYKWGVVNADVAKADFALQEVSSPSGQCFYLKFAGGTNKFFDKFFKVSYLFESKFLKSNLDPVYFHRESYEGNYWVKNTYTWRNGCRTLDAKVTKSTRPAADTTITKDEIIYDVVGMFYKIRSLDLDALKKGGSRKITFALDKNSYDVTVSYVTSENRKSAELGTFACDKYCLMLRRHKGGVNLADETQFAMKDKGEGELGPMYIWLSPDQARVPLFFQVPLAVGAVNGRIYTMNGTKVPVTPVEK